MGEDGRRARRDLEADDGDPLAHEPTALRRGPIALDVPMATIARAGARVMAVTALDRLEIRAMEGASSEREEGAPAARGRSRRDESLVPAERGRKDAKVELGGYLEHHSSREAPIDRGTRLGHEPPTGPRAE